MEDNYLVFLNVHSQGRLVHEGRLVRVRSERPRTRTHQYVGGDSLLWSPHNQSVRNFNWFVNELHHYCNRDLGARFFYKRVPRSRGIRTLVHIENEGDVQGLAEQGRYHAFSNIYIIYTNQMGGNGNEDAPSSSVGSS